MTQGDTQSETQQYTDDMMTQDNQIGELAYLLKQIIISCFSLVYSCRGCSVEIIECQIDCMVRFELMRPGAMI